VKTVHQPSRLRAWLGGTAAAILAVAMIVPGASGGERLVPGAFLSPKV